MDEKGYIIDWMKHFLNSRNLIFKTIETIEPHERYDLYVKHKTKDQYVLAEPYFGLNTIGKLSADKHIILAGFNTEENFQFLVERWKQLAALPNLSVYIINPLSEPDTKWVISPYVHQRICDNSSLKTGLRAMFETVQVITREQIKSLINQQPSF